MYRQYKRLGVSELTPWTEDIDMSGVSVSKEDVNNGSPLAGDMIARNPANHLDKWLVAKKYFDDNLELAQESSPIESFEEALDSLKLGHKVCRSGWNGKGMFLFLVPGSKFKVNRAPLLGIYPEGTEIDYQPHIDMKTADGTIVPWLASQSDILANDWEMIDE